MNEYIGLICPFCKEEIKEGETIKVCPECNIPHHESCWEKNGGCSTPGCSQQHQEEQAEELAGICLNCGAPMDENQDFCPECGTPRGQVKKRVCSNCGAELENDQEYCHKCGHKAESQANTDSRSVDSDSEKKKKGKKGIIIGAIVAAVAALAVLAVFLLPKIFVSVDDLCAQGQYEKAYEKASEEEKHRVLAESVIAYLSQETSDSLKDPSSFVLRDAYYNGSYNKEEERIYQQAVLYISGKNSYGGTVSNYWIYTATKEGVWSLFGTCSSLSVDKDDEDYFYALFAKVIVESDDCYSLDKASIKNINNLFSTGSLEEVNAIRNDLIDITLLPIDGDE